MKKVLSMFLSLVVIGNLYSGTYGGGSGSSGDPYLISTAAHLIELSNTSGDWRQYYFKQTADITFDETEANVDWDGDGTATWDTEDQLGFSPIGIGINFSGTYDGDGHTIKNLFINRGSTLFIGLFSLLVTGATLKNLGLIDVDITGNISTGGLVGSAEGSLNIENCFVSGSVTAGFQYGGGLVGYLSTGTISNSFSRASVSGVMNVGGLVGQNRGIINNSYSTGEVSGSSDVGGFVGYSSSSMNVSNCFWNVETDGIDGNSSGANNYGATGKTTTEMKSVATFTETDTEGLTTAWDFVTNPNDDAADNDYWDIDLSRSINSGYPYLSWQDGTDTSLPVTLSFFTGKATKTGVLLEWETSAEIENAGFVLRRMENGERKTEELVSSYQTNSALQGQGSVTKSTKYQFTDSKVEAGKSYTYTLYDVDFSGKETMQAEIEVKLESEGAIIADEYTLRSIYPNPFNAVFTLPFTLHEAMRVKVALYNISGQEVLTILNSELTAGEYRHSVNVDALPSAVYLLNTQIGTSINTQKIVLLK